MAAAQQPDAPAPAAAAPPAAAAAAPGDGAKKNRIKKLKAQYTAILELQQRADAGQVLDAGQAEKVARKAAVADELASMGAELPDPPPLPAAADDGVSAAEMQAALDALMLGGGAVPPRKAPPGANPMLRRQFQLLAENPQSDYFLTMPEPFPDMVRAAGVGRACCLLPGRWRAVWSTSKLARPASPVSCLPIPTGSFPAAACCQGVALSDGMGKAFMMTMRPRAEAGALLPSPPAPPSLPAAASTAPPCPAGRRCPTCPTCVLPERLPCTFQMPRS